MSHLGSNCPSGHTRRRQKKPPTAPHRGAAAELPLGNVRYRGMSAEIANDRLWPKADIHNSKTIAPVLQPCILALSLSQPRSGCAPSAGHGEGMDARVEATQEQLPDGPPLYPGPLCGGESGRSPASAKRGCSFLLVTSLLLRAFCPSPFGPASLFAHASCVHVDKQKRSNSASTGGRKLFALNAEADKRIARERAPTRAAM